MIFRVVCVPQTVFLPLVRSGAPRHFDYSLLSAKIGTWMGKAPFGVLFSLRSQSAQIVVLSERWLPPLVALRPRVSQAVCSLLFALHPVFILLIGWRPLPHSLPYSHVIRLPRVSPNELLTNVYLLIGGFVAVDI